MPRQVILLRGINIGATNRLSMPQLREVLAAADFTEVETYLQSGNIVVSHAASPAGLAAEIRRLLSKHFELSVPVLVLTREQLEAAVSENPFKDLAERDPKHFLVTFLSQQPDASAVQELKAFAADADDEFDACGCALYSWHPGGIHVSKLPSKFTEKRLQVEVVTSRNWTTVTNLLEIASA